MKFLNLITALTGCLLTTTCLAHAVNASELRVLWEQEIEGRGEDSRNRGFENTIIDFEPRADDAVALFGNEGTSSRIIVVGKDINSTIRIESEEVIYSIAPASDGGFYGTGSAERVYFWEMLSFFMLDPTPKLDALVVRFDADGQKLWETKVGGPGFQVGSEVVELSNGNVIVLGNDGRGLKLWTFSSAGQLRWEQVLGRQRGNVAAVPNGGVAVLGHESQESDESFSEDAVLWLLDSEGALSQRVVVREDINRMSSSFYFSGSIVTQPDGIVVTTTRGSTLAPLPTEISKLDLQGNRIWTASPDAAHCDVSPTSAASGDILLACADEYEDGKPRGFRLHRFNSKDGSASSTSAVLPSCQHSQTAVSLYVVGEFDDSVTLLGSRPTFNVGESCSWFGELSLQD